MSATERMTNEHERMTIAVGDVTHDFERSTSESEHTASASGRMADDPARDDLLILVDGLDRECGTATKWEIHTGGLLHRAFSVVLTHDGEGGPELLLAKRALSKYHSGGLWANSCCSHPRAGENVLEAARRRTREELGCEAVDLREVAAFAYRAEFESGLAEYEFDHVILAHYTGDIAFDPSEVDAVRWVSFDALAAELAAEPRTFAAWAPMVLSMAMAAYQRR